MNAYNFTHLSLLALGGTIKGRTKLQKTIYFLGLLTDSLEDLGYRAHYYGPYSDAVADAINRMKSLGFIQESTLGVGAVNAAGFEIARHDFTLTAEGLRVAGNKADKNPDAWGKIESAVGLFTAAGDLDYMEMSVAAKTIYMLSTKEKPATPSELCESARALGWNPDQEEITRSIGFLKKLDLVETEVDRI